MKFTVYIPNTEVVAHDLVDVSIEAPILQRIKWLKPIADLTVGERTIGMIVNHCYECQRTE